MPVVHNLFINNDTILAIWRIDETLDEIRVIDDYAGSLCQRFSAQYKSETRVLEKVIARLLLRFLYSKLEGKGSISDCPEIIYNDDGCPSLTNNWQISISHTKHYVAVILSCTERVGVDIEFRSDRVERVASHLVREDEAYQTTEDLQLIWCAKETVYKYFSSQHLSLFEMKVGDISPTENGSLVVENLRNNELLPVHYSICSDFVLTYAVK